MDFNKNSKPEEAVGGVGWSGGGGEGGGLLSWLLAKLQKVFKKREEEEEKEVSKSPQIFFKSLWVQLVFQDNSAARTKKKGHTYNKPDWSE